MKLKWILVISFITLLIGCGSDEDSKNKIWDETPIPTVSLLGSGCKIEAESKLECDDTTNRTEVQLQLDALKDFKDDLDSYMEIDNLHPGLRAEASSLHAKASAEIARVTVVLIEVPKLEDDFEAIREATLAIYIAALQTNEESIELVHGCLLIELVETRSCELSTDHDEALAMLEVAEQALDNIDYIIENDSDLTGSEQARLLQKAMLFEELRLLYEARIKGMNFAVS